MANQAGNQEAASDAMVSPQGAQWIRVDFHLHTRADKEFKYDGEPNDFTREYVDALEQAGIGLGVITNHNKFDLDEFKALRTKARKRGIGLLPGVELSVSEGTNGIHMLIVFSDAWIGGNDAINPFLTAAFQPRTPQDYEHENGRTTANLLGTLKRLEEVGHDFFVVFAHVEQRSGLWKELGGGRITDLGRDACFRRHTLGFQKVKSNDKSGQGEACRAKVKGWLRDWYPAEVEGSDPKFISEIGKGEPCFLKLGERSFEALKFALGLPMTRVAQQIPRHTGSHVRRMTIAGGALDGQTIHFAPELNTLIGIRGSGKSSILELLRYALDIPRGEGAQDARYKDELVAHILGSGGTVTVEARNQFDQDFTVTRQFGEAPKVLTQETLQPGVSIRETVLRRPIYFGQKDLSSSGEGFEADLVEKLVSEKLRPLRTRIEAQRQRVREAARKWTGLDQITEQIEEQETIAKDAEFRLQTFEELGVAERLQRMEAFQQDQRMLDRAESRATAFMDALNSLIAEHEDELRNTTRYESSENVEFFQSYMKTFGELVDTVVQLQALERSARDTIKRLADERKHFKAKQDALQEDFAEVARELQAELRDKGAVDIRPDAYLKERKRLEHAKDKLRALRNQDAERDRVGDELGKEISELHGLWEAEFKIIRGELEHINRQDTPLRLEAHPQGDRKVALDFMQQIFRGTAIRAATLQRAMEGHDNFGDLWRALAGGAQPPGTTPDLFRDTFYRNLPEFLTLQIPNRFVIRFEGKELRHHSIGQRASALLLYVLSQNQNDVIIIDQPEDDLDNQTIYDQVIRLLLTLKPRTQFIFATHNANFPVLGDAEQVIACSYADHRISADSGSVDARHMQQRIISIMEGGQAAFDRRKEVYNQWKPRS